MAVHPADIEKGALNLLQNCALTKSGDRLLVIHEEPGRGYFDDAIVGAVAAAGERLGAQVTVREVPFDPRAKSVPAQVKELMNNSEQTIFLARLGDQLRFSDLAAGSRAVVSYALDVGMLGSGFGTAHYAGFVALKDAINQAVANATEIHVTCPRGTDYRGATSVLPEDAEDVGIARFPMLIFTPVAAKGFTGRVAMPGFLVGTGSMYYDPYAVALDGPVFGQFEGGRITGFEGDKAAVSVAQEHYQYVADLFEIDRDFVHSWHAGIHPGCSFTGAAADNYQRWSGSAFGNPRLLHVHTCGAYAPGEISWNVADPTVRLDGVAVWEDGVLHPERIQGAAEILSEYPDVAAVFADPVRDIGL